MAMSVEFQSFIDEIIDKNDIVEVVSMYAKLKRSGRTYRGLCPIHNDRKNPSLSVDPQSRLFKCFGCGAGGTVIQFVMAKENLDFMEAVRLLADRSGVAMPQGQSPKAAREAVARRDKKARLLEMHKAAARYFYDCLCQKEHFVALEYLRGRNLSDATIKKFGLGYAPRKSGLGDYLKEKGFSLSEIEEVPLIYKGKDGYFDKFRGRVMFPIFDVRGDVIAFGGRTIFDDKAKYMNSNDSLIYNKGQNLFAFHIAKDSKQDDFLLMEGNVDVITLHQAGFDNATASLGTAFTPEQAKLIKRYKDKAVLCYDSDAAGQKATYAAGKILMDAGISVKVLTVTGAKDPDEYINKYGAEMFQALLDKAENFIEYKIRKTAEKYNFDDTEDKIAFIVEAAQIFAEIKDAVKMEIYVNDIAKKVNIKPEKFMAKIAELRQNEEQKQAGLVSAVLRREEQKKMENRRGGRGKSHEEGQLYKAEKLFLSCICDKRVYDFVKDEVDISELSEALHRKVGKKITDMHETGEAFEATRFIMDFPEEEKDSVTDIIYDDGRIGDKMGAAADSIRIINKNIQKNKALKIDKDDVAGYQELIMKLAQDKK